MLAVAWFTALVFDLAAERLYQPLGVFFDYLEGLVGYEAFALLLVFVPVVAVPVAEEVFVIVVAAVLFAEG